MVSQIQLFSSTMSSVMQESRTYPLMGLGFVIYSEYGRAKDIVRVAQESGVFSLSLDNQTAAQMTLFIFPVSICVMSEFVSEERLEETEEIYYLFQKLVYGVYMVSLGVGLIKAAKHRQFFPFCYYSSGMAGALVNLAEEKNYLSGQTYKKICVLLFYLERASSLYLAKDVASRIEIAISIILFRKLVSNSTIEVDVVEDNPSLLNRVKHLFFKYLIVGRRMRDGVMFFDPYTHMVHQFDREGVQNGTIFLRKEIYDKMTPYEQGLFNEIDPSLIYYVLSKAVYIYAFGSKKDEEIPIFFQEETQGKIRELRAQELQEGATQWLETHFESLEKYEEEIPEPHQAIRTLIANAGNGEQRGGMFLIKCWGNVRQSPPVGDG